MDSYEKVRVVGRGAFGVCWLCRDKISSAKVIVKMINTHGMSEKEEKYIQSEVNLLKKVQHPLIIGYIDYFTIDNQLAIVMQYAEGGTLEKLINEQRQIKENIPEKTVLEYFTQILIALDHMHSKHIVHRDLKPANILMNRRKTILKLSDFGISKELGTKSAASTVIGTPNYLSPEICESRPYNQKSDMWSLGCVLFELLQLERAFDGENLPAIVMKITQGRLKQMGEHVTPEAKKLVDALLKTNEKSRPDVTDLLVDPVVLPYLISIHCDLGRLEPPTTDKRKPSASLSSRLRTYPTQSTLRAHSSSMSLLSSQHLTPTPSSIETGMKPLIKNLSQSRISSQARYHQHRFTE
uniref:non-specific serine/threonine protein kinase n=1 Tax=Caenorhabditis tropicalis TaxID=1561998 RepID=A0A1I7U4B4_9PELO